MSELEQDGLKAGLFLSVGMCLEFLGKHLENYYLFIFVMVLGMVLLLAALFKYGVHQTKKIQIPKLYKYILGLLIIGSLIYGFRNANVQLGDVIDIDLMLLFAGFSVFYGVLLLKRKSKS